MRQSPIQRGEAAELQGDFPAATAAFEIASQDPAPDVAAEGELGLGRMAWRQGRFSEALAALNRARALALRTDDEELRARIENGAGAVHFSKGEYAQARAFYQTARELSKTPSFHAKVDVNLGVIANVQGDLDGARAAYMQALNVFRAIGDAPNEAMALHNLGMLLADEAKWDEADEAYRESLAIFERQGNPAMVASVALNRAELLAARGELESAIASCELALHLAAELGDEASRGEALRWRGHAYRRLAHDQRAQRDLAEAIRIARRLTLPLLEAESLEELGRLLADRGDSVTARARLQEALPLYEKLKATREAQRVAKALRALGGAPE